MAALLVMCVDADLARQAFLKATTADVRKLVIGLATFGVAIAYIFDPGERVREAFKDEVPTASGLSGTDGARHDRARDWWLSLPSDGQEGAIREMQLLIRAPNVPERWAIKELAGELAESLHSEGSDFLDRRLAQVLRCELNGLKPSQSTEDAMQLLRQRFGGTPSTCEWDVRFGPLEGGGHRAWIAIRLPAKGNREPRWRKSHVGWGPTEAIAIVRAVLERESWTWTP
ncbi:MULTISPECIES: hypothetical protein [unclassified Dyella]|uniref:hypothetical protein n=1 Tax=Dyella sp. ASV21 TaxID=2795114 RepID=UPI0018EDF1A7|nr:MULTISPECIES: hypothetical protein [unclassified Dyella]